MDGKKYVLILVILSFMLILSGCGDTPLSQEDEIEVVTLLKRAENLFSKGDQARLNGEDDWSAYYGQAALEYEKAYKNYGLYNGKLFYNTANAWFNAGDIGRAIVNYKRAGMLLPYDSNVVTNLSVARKKRIDTIEKESDNSITRILFFWHFDVHFELRLILLIVLVTALLVISLIRLFVKVRWFTTGAVILGIFILLFAGSVGVTAFIEDSIRQGVVLDESVVARKGDSEIYEASFETPLHRGTEFILLEDRSGWMNIRLEDGNTCWVPGDSVELVF